MSNICVYLYHNCITHKEIAEHALPASPSLRSMTVPSLRSLRSMTVQVRDAVQATEESLTADRPVNFRNRAAGQQMHQQRQTQPRTSIHIFGILTDRDNF